MQPFGERRGGSDNILFTFLRHVDRGRVEPLVVFLGEGSFEREVAALGVPTAVLPAGRLRNPAHLVATVARLARLLRAERPDLVMNWLSTAQLYGGPAALASGLARRTVWWQLDLFADRSSAGARLSERLETLRGRALDRVATVLPAIAVGAVSESAANAQRRLRPRRFTVTVLPGIDPPESVPHADLAELRSRLSIPEGIPVVGTVGRLFAWKGHHLLIEALAQVPAGGAHGLVVGGGGHRGDDRYEAYLRRRIAELSLTDRVTLTGQVSDAAPYLQLMDVFVNASSPEPFGLVLLEAMALGVPVVAVAAGGPTEIVVSGGSGLLTASNDPDDLAQAIDTLLADPGLRAELGAAGKVRWERRFTAERMTRELEQRLTELSP